MTSKHTSILTNSCLIGSGLLVWAFSGSPLTNNLDLAHAPNPLGIKRSPYGEVFAIAMQGGIDRAFHESILGNHVHKLEEINPTIQPSSGKDRSLKSRFQNMLTSLSCLPELRTNPKPPGKSLRFQLRRSAEDKLRFAYELDPSNYANYNSLHFFLTEPTVGTRPELTDSTLKLADDTIAYCLGLGSDPRPALTAAAACTNVLNLMFDDHHKKDPKFTTLQMRQYLTKLDSCISRYDQTSTEWSHNHNWDLLSEQRIKECEERSHFIRKIRDAAEKTILIFEGKMPNPQAAN